MAKKKKMVVKGVGQFLVKRFNPELNGVGMLALGKMNSLRFSFTNNMESIFGGDSTTEFDTIKKDSPIDIVAVDAQFDLNMIKLLYGCSGAVTANDLYVDVVSEGAIVGDSGREIQRLQINGAASAVGTVVVTIGGVAYTINVDPDNDASELQEGIALIIANDTNITAAFNTTVLGDVVTFTAINSGDLTGVPTVGGTAGVTGVGSTVTNGAGASGKVTPIYAGSLFSTPGFVVRLVEDNSFLTQTTSSPGVTEFMVEGDGKLAFNTALNGKKVEMSYKRADANVDVYAILKDGIPFDVEVVHVGEFENGGTMEGVNIHVYKCRVNGTIAVDTSRNTASTHELSLKVLDPERPDKRLGTIKRFSLPGSSNC